MKFDSIVLAGITVLASLVVVFDYALKYSHLKIPFPWYPVLKFDFTGVPIDLALYLFGFAPSAFTSLVALFAIVTRSGDWVGGSMKALAELSTIAGMALGLRAFPRFRKGASFALGILMRCLVMFSANLPVSTVVYQMPFEAALGLSPFIVAFNVVQGALGMSVSLFLYQAVRRRVTSLTEEKSQVSRIARA
jgi:riboflavin transporter FmnP